MSGQYTPGVLGTDCREHDEPYQNIALVIGARKVATVCIDDAPVHDFNTEQRANARRLVACWNVCDGLSTDSLERMPGQFFKPLNLRLLEVETQRKALLGALTEINNWLVCAAIATPEDMAQSFAHMQGVAENAIAAVQEGGPT